MHQLSVLIIALWCGLLWCMTVNANSDAFFMDPQAQQTYPVDIEGIDSQQVEDQILKLLGLPNTPRPAQTHLRDNAAPQFMMHLYQEIQKHEGLDEIMPGPTPILKSLGTEFRNVSFDLDQTHKVEDSDIVISFVNQVKKAPLDIEHEDDKRYYFELDDVPKASELKDAELRLYKTKSHHESQHYFISVFRIDDEPKSRNDFGLTLLDTVAVLGAHEGWLVFNVTKAMQSWKDNPQSNVGILVQVHSLTGDEVLPHRMGVINRHGEKDRQGFMVAFFKSLEPLSSKIPQIRRPRKKRAAPSDSYWDDPQSSRYSRKLCQRKQLYVKFKRLRFDNWIIAPEGYPAFYCEGECTFPLSSHMNATNHAIVQTLVSLIQPKKYPKACCAPKKLSPITVLYFDETQNVVMKRYRNMVVQSCGCH